GINLIKMFAAIAPLMGLLGTVIGMIMTFQTITLFGTGDPKIMAGNISLALVTTALGLICALPLILIHSVVAGKSKSVLQKLDEQSAGLIAAIAEKESK
ncbi:MAG: biopolymer transport protein ExbB, partial [Alteromonadaceae bacterium]